MFERYNENARHAVFFARYEASHYGSPYCESEHLLLGILREDKPLTNRFLPAGSTNSIRKQIESQTTVRAKLLMSVDLPLSYEYKRVLVYAAEEADRLCHEHIGTEHLLLGLLREENCFAAKMLKDRDVQLDRMRDELAKNPERIDPDTSRSKDHEKLKGLIKEARRELRRASGVPLTSEEQAEVRRMTEIEAMELFLSKSLGARIVLGLRYEVIWTEHGATAQVTVDDHRFLLFKDHDGFYLFVVQGDGEPELLRMQGSDPNFANRVLVAIDDTSFNTGKPGPG